MAVLRQFLRLVPKQSLAPSVCRSPNARSFVSSDNPKGSSTAKEATKDTINASTKNPPVHKKTQAELDKELELKMQGLAGDGGEAGVELEDGQPVAMKRSVRNNMFRYI
ncbi:hypothetical protein GQ43DRAFT_428598 [Delitschia confertaspora ATCC 74209]|uniref:Uncharacterized protein n=1 Tax=Delitschia confertaspora ATCC 74209 TaxID=1513339 RepID=A0A9P4JX73_9PLEO|nr:hypothetical protein GQ43DRAFT_428598 [Delitschia confertaspora ATCC 74209]